MTLEIIDSTDESTTILGSFSNENNTFYVVESLGKIKFLSKSPMQLKKFSDFKDTHDFFRKVGVPIGVSAINAYKQNNRMVAKMFAKNQFERQFYQKLSDDLKSTKKYTVKKRFMNGGVLFELIRT